VAAEASRQGFADRESGPAGRRPARPPGARWGGLPVETDARHEEEREIDARVVAQASHGDRAAFTAMVHHYERRLRVLAYQILQDPQAMDDALQEVFVAAYAALPGFRGDAALGTWLYRITCNVCLQSLRTASRRPADRRRSAGRQRSAGPRRDGRGHRQDRHRGGPRRRDRARDPRRQDRPRDDLLRPSHDAVVESDSPGQAGPRASGTGHTGSAQRGGWPVCA